MLHISFVSHKGLVRNEGFEGCVTKAHSSPHVVRVNIVFRTLAICSKYLGISYYLLNST